jgi:hypothetical protein
MQNNGYETETMKMRVGDHFPTSFLGCSAPRAALVVTSSRACRATLPWMI